MLLRCIYTYDLERNTANASYKKQIETFIFHIHHEPMATIGDGMISSYFACSCCFRILAYPLASDCHCVAITLDDRIVVLFICLALFPLVSLRHYNITSAVYRSRIHVRVSVHARIQTCYLNSLINSRDSARISVDSQPLQSLDYRKLNGICAMAHLPLSQWISSEHNALVQVDVIYWIWLLIGSLQFLVVVRKHTKESAINWNDKLGQNV